RDGDAHALDAERDFQHALLNGTPFAAVRVTLTAFQPTYGDSVSIRARRTPFKLRKLLVIDDDAKLLSQYRDLLSPYGFEVLTAPDGQEAIPLVEQNPDILLVILDLAMPRMDGREWLRWFRRTRQESPVIVISAYKLAATEPELGPAAVLGK